MPAPYEFFRFPLKQCTASDISQWRGLLVPSAAAANAFISPEFCQAVDDAQGGVEVLMAKAGEKIVAVLPLQIERRWFSPLRSYTQVGSEISDYFQIVEGDASGIDMQEMLRGVGIPSLYYAYAPKRVTKNNLPLQLCTSTYRLTSSAEENLWDIAVNLNRKFWNDGARCERRIENEIGPLDFTWHEPSGDQLNLLIKLKLSQYSKTGQASAPLFRHDIQNILRGLLLSGSTECRGTLSTLRANGEVLALHYGIQTRNHLHYWFPVYDPKYSKYSPGKVLLAKIIKSAKSQNINSIDFGEGASDYKLAASNQSEELGKGLVELGWKGRVSSFPRKLSWRINA